MFSIETSERNYSQDETANISGEWNHDCLQNRCHQCVCVTYLSNLNRSVFHTFSSIISAPSNNFHFKSLFWGVSSVNQANAQVLLLNPIIFSYYHVTYDL